MHCHVLVTRHGIWIWVYWTFITRNYKESTLLLIYTLNKSLKQVLSQSVIVLPSRCSVTVFTRHRMEVLLLWYSHPCWMAAGSQLTFHAGPRCVPSGAPSPTFLLLLHVYLLPSSGLLFWWHRSTFTVPLPSSGWRLLLNYPVMSHCFLLKAAHPEWPAGVLPFHLFQGDMSVMSAVSLTNGTSTSCWHQHFFFWFQRHPDFLPHGLGLMLLSWNSLLKAAHPE
jgi:hypothetical protein